MKVEQLGLGLTAAEIAAVRRSLGREPNETEWSIIDAEWSEHSSYKSSRALLKLFPTTGKRVVLGPGYDAGVVDVGGGYVVTLHIESHNHPSAVDPYGGASTGIGGVLRDILSVASRPIALVDILRFGSIEKSGHSRWLFKNVVRGIADYGNCISGDDMVYYTNSSAFHAAKAESLFEDFTSAEKLSPEFTRNDLTISKPKVDLRVLSYDFEKGEAQFRRVSRMYQAKVTRMLRVRTALGRRISVTPDHPMFVVKDGTVHTVQARELKKGDSVPLVLDFPYPEERPANLSIDLIEELRVRGAVTGTTVTCRGRKLREFRSQLDPVLRRAGVSASSRSHFLNYNYLPLNVFLAVEALGGLPLARKDLLLYPRRGRVTKVPAVLDLDPEFARLVGYFLSEGCRYDEGQGKTSGGKTSRLIWTFRKDETEYIDDVCAILDNASIRYGKRETKTNAVQIKVSSQILGWLFREVLGAGHDSYTKQIPNIFYQLPIGLSFEVLKGIMRGDGSVRTSAEEPSLELRFGSASPVLFQQALLLLQSLGYVPATSTSFHTKSTVPFHELTISGRTRIESLKQLFSKEIIARVDRRLAKYSQPSMEHLRSVSYGKFATVKISQIDAVDGDFSVYNFEVEGTHNYVTSGGIVTHNCVGVPTVAGEIEFDESFERNCLVDVACVGVGKKGTLLLGEAKEPGDVLVLVGGSTGRDGIKGAAFASKNLKEDEASERSSVQVPDPFMKKLLLDSLLEAIANGAEIRGMKDLGGGGLSTALSEVASKGGTGVDVELKTVPRREGDMSPTEVMISESQERMLLVLPPERKEGKDVIPVLEKYGVPYSVVGRVTSTPNLVLRWGGRVVADLPSSLVTEAPLIDWPSRRPRTRPARRERAGDEPGPREALLSLLASPNVASKRWVYQQYDHEVGVSTVVKPGQADAAVMRLPNGRFLAVKGDGNSRLAAIDPYVGAAGCVAEACRNVVAVGAEPIAMLDHLQSGDPSDPEVYWAFRENLRGMADYCKAFGLPVVGGKVSFYNEDSATGRAIKPSPIALVVGLADEQDDLRTMALKERGDHVLIVGETRRELLGSELSSRFPSKAVGAPPRVDPRADLETCRGVTGLIRKGLVNAVHDCSSGGLAVAAAEMAIAGGLGLSLDLSPVPGGCPSPLETLFSESHGRFVVAGPDAGAISAALGRAGVTHARLGKVGGTSMVVSARGKPVLRLPVSSLREAWERAIPELMD